jgi:hypothetical protein
MLQLVNRSSRIEPGERCLEVLVVVWHREPLFGTEEQTRNRAVRVAVQWLPELASGRFHCKFRIVATLDQVVA